MDHIIDFNTSVNMDALRGLPEKLKMVLWAGDCVHNGITDIERLPNFDIYLCYGYPYTLQDNLDYINKRGKNGLICVLDIENKNQMNFFTELFKGRFSIIDSDYNGNTPTLEIQFYHRLLAPGGKAYNIRGINGCYTHLTDAQNLVEIFAPIISPQLSDLRRYTPQMIELAKDSKLQVDMAWTSPDLKHIYYDKIRAGQELFSGYRKALNPNHLRPSLFKEGQLEEYWDQLSSILFDFKFQRALQEKGVEDAISPYVNRLIQYLKSKIWYFVDNHEDFNNTVGDDLEKLLSLYVLSNIIYSGLSFHIGYYLDIRIEKPVYGHYLSKK
jgi:hypothetical protein